MSGRSDPVLSRQGWSNVEDFIEHQFIFCVGAHRDGKRSSRLKLWLRLSRKWATK